MAKFRPKVESVDAVQVRFTDKGAWPKWLEGAVSVKEPVPSKEGEPGTMQVKIEDGDFIVREDGVVRVYKQVAFKSKFEPSRQPKGEA